MATATSLLQTFTTFDMSVSPYTLTLYGTAGGQIYITPVAYPTVSGETRGSIVLPNGVKYDPHQTYAAPQILGTVDAVLNIRPLNLSALEDTEDSITRYYYTCISCLGIRGTLYSGGYYPTSASATARLLKIKMDWNLPKQIPTSIGGTGNAAPGIKTATITLTFDLITAWTFTP